MTIPDTVASIGFMAFYGCRGLTNIAVAAANPAYAGPNGVLFNKAQTILIQFPCGRGGSYAIPNGVTALEHYASYYCPSLTSVTMPNTLTYVGVQDFYYCTSLTNVTMGTGLTVIDVQAFMGCASLKSLTIPNNVTYLGDRAFANCTGLTNVTMGNGITSLHQLPPAVAGN